MSVYPVPLVLACVKFAILSVFNTLASCAPVAIGAVIEICGHAHQQFLADPIGNRPGQINKKEEEKSSRENST